MGGAGGAGGEGKELVGSIKYNKSQEYNEKLKNV